MESEKSAENLPINARLHRHSWRRVREVMELPSYTQPLHRDFNYLRTLAEVIHEAFSIAQPGKDNYPVRVGERPFHLGLNSCRPCPAFRRAHVIERAFIGRDDLVGRD